MNQPAIQQLSDRVDWALQALKSGQPRLIDAKILTREFRNITVSQTTDLFPADPHFAQHLAGRLHVIQELEHALDQLHRIGVAQETRLRDIPCLDTALRYSLNAIAANQPGGISFR